MTDMTREELLADIAADEALRKEHRREIQRRTDAKRYGADPKEANRERHRRRRGLLVKLIDIMGGRCLDCRKRFDQCVYDFHHRDPKTKKFNVNVCAMDKAWSTVLLEAEKCDLLCANCHRIRHNDKYGSE